MCCHAALVVLYVNGCGRKCGNTMNPLETLAHSLPPSRGLNTEFDCCEPVGQTVQAYTSYVWTSTGKSGPIASRFSTVFFEIV